MPFGINPRRPARTQVIPADSTSPIPGIRTTVPNTSSGAATSGRLCRKPNSPAPKRAQGRNVARFWTRVTASKEALIDPIYEIDKKSFRFDPWELPVVLRHALGTQRDNLSGRRSAITTQRGIFTGLGGQASHLHLGSWRVPIRHNRAPVHWGMVRFAQKKL